MPSPRISSLMRPYEPPVEAAAKVEIIDPDPDHIDEDKLASNQYYRIIGWTGRGHSYQEGARPDCVPAS